MTEIGLRHARFLASLADTSAKVEDRNRATVSHSAIFAHAFAVVQTPTLFLCVDLTQVSLGDRVHADQRPQVESTVSCEPLAGLRRGVQPAGRPIDPRDDWQEWPDILRAAGVPHHGVHAARHSAASIMIDEGIALTVVQEMLGHSDIRVTRGYVHTASPVARDAAARMGRAIFGPTVPKTVPTGILR